MITFPLKRTLTTSLAVLYFTTHVALGYAVETNIWAERRKAASQKNGTSQPMQVASLPISMRDSAALLQQLPSINRSLPTGSKWSDINKQKSLGFSKQFQSLIDSIPQAYGSIQDIFDAGNSRISPVVLVQDIHLNAEAQNNIAAVLQELINQKQVGTIGVEGAFEQFDFKPFRQFADKKITQDVASQFLASNLMAAPSYVGITSAAEPPLFVGVDDVDHYSANVKAYLSTIRLKEKTKKEISQAKKDLSQAKIKGFSLALRGFDDVRTAYHQGTIGIGAYVQKLNSYETEKDFTVEQFLEAYQLESTLDFKRVELERRQVIEKLTAVLKKEELNSLLAQSLAYRMGKISFGIYYQNLKNLCEAKAVHLARTPAFENYVRYVLLSDGIKGESLFAGVAKLEENVLKMLAVTPEEKLLAAQSEHLLLTEKLVEFSLTPTEWKKYKGTPPGLPIVRRGEELAFEKFYEEADIRSEKMVHNLFSATTNPTPAPAPQGRGTPIVGSRTTSMSLTSANVSSSKVDSSISKNLSRTTPAALSPATALFSKTDSAISKNPSRTTPTALSPATALFSKTDSVISKNPSRTTPAALSPATALFSKTDSSISKNPSRTIPTALSPATALFSKTDSAISKNPSRTNPTALSPATALFSKKDSSISKNMSGSSQLAPPPGGGRAGGGACRGSCRRWFSFAANCPAVKRAENFLRHRFAENHQGD